MIKPWQLNEVDLQLMDLALAEDLGAPYTDITTNTLFVKAKGRAKAAIISKHKTPIIISGLPCLTAILNKLSPDCEIKTSFKDGDQIQPNDTLVTISGPANILLMAERTLLNFLQRLSAVATLTQQFVQRVQHTPAKILDTRKTLPGFRHLDKYAVSCGGGVNHRMGLYDAIMIKDTHIDYLGGIQKALDALPDKNTHPVIVEVRHHDELAAVLASHKATRVLLDNMSIDALRDCVRLCQGQLPTEASGNMTLDRVASVAETGVDFISVGQITHSAGNVDLSMHCELSNG